MEMNQAIGSAGRGAHPGHWAGRGFSMVEVLLAVMILGVGLVMVAAIFPVGAEWTRQNVEESVGAVVGRNAVAIIQTKYTPADLATVPQTLVPLPGIGAGGKLPLGERAYQFGGSPPYPAAKLAEANYFWTAMIRQEPQPAQQPSATASTPPDRYLNRYDLYIFVFRRAGMDQSYTGSGTAMARGSGENIPYLDVALSSSTTVPAGSIMVGRASGTVYRKLPTGMRPNATTADTDTNTNGGVNFIWAPPADGANMSPLVYVYQTTVSF